jgi:hypothetical protein
MFKQLMIDFDFQFASRTRSKRKLSVLSIVKVFDKFLCGIARDRASSESDEVPSQPFGGGTAATTWIIVNLLYHMNSYFLFISGKV